MSYLVDTDVLGELIRKTPDPVVAAWADRIVRVFMAP